MKALSLFTRFLAVLLLSSFWASAQSNIVFLTLTFTNAASNGNSFVLIGSTRTWTNSVSSSPSTLIIASNTTANLDKTNFFRHVSLYPFGSGATRLLCRNMGSNSVQFEAQPGQSIAYTINGVWGYGTLSTSVVYQPGIPYVFPLTIYQAATRTAIVSDVVSSLGQWSTNSIPAEATSLSGFVNASNAQTISGAKVFSTSVSGTIGAVSNGTWLSPVTTNLTNYGASLASLGSGAGSLQLGENATASGASSIALGLDSLANGSSAIAIGPSASGTNTGSIAIGGLSYSYGIGGVAIGGDSGAEGEYSSAFGGGSRALKTNSVTLGRAAISNGTNSMALGTMAIADGNSSIVVGVSATATNENSVAIGTSASSQFQNSMALGNGATTTASNQVVLGNAAHTVKIPGVIEPGSVTNAGFTGSNYLGGSWSTATASIAPSDGANALEIGVVPVVTITGGSLSSGIWTLDGIYPGWEGRIVRLINLTGYGSTLEHQSGLAAATNQFTCPGSVDLTFGNGYAIDLLYTSSKWRVLPSASLPSSVADLTVTGNISLTNTVWDDIVVNLTTLSGPAGAPPTMAAFAGPIFAWEFSGSASNALFFTLQIPHRYKHGSDLKPHIHWTKTTGSASDVIWGLDYVISSITSNYSATATTIYTTNTCPTSMQHTLSSFPTISGTGLTGSAVMVGKLYRLGETDADTAQAWGLNFDVHFEVDKLGSDSESP